jgi:hypothetical protein
MEIHAIIQPWMPIMIDNLENSKKAGIFNISPDKDIYGELTFAGPNTTLYLRDNETHGPSKANALRVLCTT